MGLRFYWQSQSGAFWNVNVWNNSEPWRTRLGRIRGFKIGHSEGSINSVRFLETIHNFEEPRLLNTTTIPRKWDSYKYIEAANIANILCLIKEQFSSMGGGRGKVHEPRNCTRNLKGNKNVIFLWRFLIGYWGFREIIFPGVADHFLFW